METNKDAVVLTLLFDELLSLDEEPASSGNAISFLYHYQQEHASIIASKNAGIY